MIRVTSPPRVALGLGAIAAAICLAACGDWRPGVTGPARAAFQFRLQPTVADNAADAYARVDAAHVTVSQAGDMLLDTTAAFRDGAGAGPTFSLRSRNPDDAFVLTTQLLTHGYVVLEGSAQARLRRARTTSVPITFAPVIAALMSPSEVLLTALEDTLRLRGAAVLVTGDTVRGAAVTWVGDGGGVIRVTADGLITALTEGEAQVSATYERLSRTTSVRVRAIVAGVDLAIDTCSMMVGETRVLTARARDRNGNELRRPITWSSGNPAVASVDANGVVTAVAAGTVTIAATSEGRSAGAVVSVRAVPIAVLEVAPAKAELLIDESRPMTARALDADGNVLTGRAVEWSSSATWIAAVDTGGWVRGVEAGTATITATSEGHSATALVTVVLPRVEVAPAQATFTLTRGAAPSSQVLSIANVGNGTLASLAATVTYGPGASGWLGVSFASTTAPTRLTVTASPGTLPGGQYTAVVTVGSSRPGAVSMQVPVTLVVQQPRVAVSRTSVFLQGRWGGPVCQAVTVFNAGAGTLDGLSVEVNWHPDDTIWWWRTMAVWAGLDRTTAPATLTVCGAGAASSLRPYPINTTITVRSTVPGAGEATVGASYNPPYW